MTKASSILVGAGVAVVAILALATWARAMPEEPEVPFEPMEIVTRDDILAAADFQALDDYYNQITLLYRGYKISFEEYMELYDTYSQRFYELWEML